MTRGTALEPEARKHYETISGIPVTPACRQSNTHEWQRASVDGLALDGSIVVEIKCGKSAYRQTKTNGQVPHYYIGQLQHILAVTGLPHIDFFCWLPDLPGVRLRIQRDDRYIDRLIVAEYAFWQQLTELRH
jgi:putative phage-type endonuclease